MERTLEARWFYRGSAPADVRAWFEQFEPAPEPERTDVYVRPPGPTLNTKLRQGRAEVKRRAAEGRRVRFHEHVTAQVELWRKWSFPLAEDEAGAEQKHAAASELWVRVEKRRRQRLFEPHEQACLLGTAAAGRADVRVELTEVTLEGQDWWSLCVEASSAEGALHDALDGMARYLFAQGTAPRLEAERSRGYAQWLLEAARTEQPAALVDGTG